MAIGPSGHTPISAPPHVAPRYFQYTPAPVNPITPEVLLEQDRANGGGGAAPVEIHPGAQAQAQAGHGQALLEEGVAAPQTPAVGIDENAEQPSAVELGGAPPVASAPAGDTDAAADIPLTKELPTAPAAVEGTGMKVVPAKPADHFLKALPEVVLVKPVKPGTVFGGGPGTRGGGPTGTTNMKPAGKRWDHDKAQGVSVNGAMISFPPFAESKHQHTAPRIVFGEGWIPQGDGRTYRTSSGAKAKVGIHPRLSVPTGAEWDKVHTRYGSGKKFESGWIVGMGKDGKPYSLSPDGKYRVLKPGFHTVGGIKVRSFFASVVNVTYPNGRFIRFDSRGNAREKDGGVGKPGLPGVQGGGKAQDGGSKVGDPTPTKGTGSTADPAPGKGGTSGGGAGGLGGVLGNLTGLLGDLGGLLGIGGGGGLQGLLDGVLGGGGAAAGAGLLGGGSGLLGGLTSMLGGVGMLGGGGIDPKIFGDLSGILDDLGGMLGGLDL